MPVSKNQLHRFCIINRCLGGTKKYWSAEELIIKLSDADFDVSIRTVIFDLELMRHDSRLGYHAPIEYCRRNKGYYYSDSSYSIYNIKLTQPQERSLLIAYAVINQLPEIHPLKAFAGLTDVVSRVMNYSLPHEDVSHIIEFEKPPLPLGIQFVNLIFDAIRDKKVMRLFLQADGNKKRELLFHPYVLKELHNQWYSVGYEQNKRKLCTIRLVAIVKAEETDHPYKKDARKGRYDYTKIFEHLIT